MVAAQYIREARARLARVEEVCKRRFVRYEINIARNYLGRAPESIDSLSLRSCLEYLEAVREYVLPAALTDLDVASHCLENALAAMVEGR